MPQRGGNQVTAQVGAHQRLIGLANVVGCMEVCHRVVDAFVVQHKPVLGVPNFKPNVQRIQGRGQELSAGFERLLRVSGAVQRPVARGGSART